MDFLDFLDEFPSETPLPSAKKRQRSEGGEHRRDFDPSVVTGVASESKRDLAPSELALPADLNERLYPYQRDGVAWLYGRHRGGCGCILADEMGLGKTVQVTAFLGAMARAGCLRTVLVVVPGTLLQTWHDAFVSWGLLPEAAVEIVHKGSRVSRQKRWQRFRFGTLYIAITTYGIIKSDASELTKITVDYVVLDEAHLIKDPSSETFKAVKLLQSVHRIAVSGTPIMNNFNELWAVLNFADESIFSCSRSEFALLNADILKGNEKDATAVERNVGSKAMETVRRKISLFMLRREKDAMGVLASLKEEVVVWVRMDASQMDQYNAFLESDNVQVALRSINTSQPLVLLTALKRICDHPWLNFNERNFAEAMAHPDVPPAAFEDFGNILSGPKLRVALRMIEAHAVDGKRTLVFSRSKRLLQMLDILLRRSSISSVRFDGDTPIQDRASAIKAFNEGSSSACLATTQVGGVGVTFTGASRVILLDPSWNPAADAQAVDRVHRIGQSDDVVVYRLVMGGTVDEKVYRNQVFKMMAARQMHAVDSESASAFHRYFTHTQLRNMFEVGGVMECETAAQLQEIHPDGLSRFNVAALRELLGADLLDVSSHSAIFTKTDASDHAPQSRVRRPRAQKRRTPTPPPPALPLPSSPITDVCPVDDAQTFVPAVRIKPRCTIFDDGNVGAIQEQDGAEALVMVRGIKFARIHMSEVHRGSIALDINDYMLDSDCDDGLGANPPVRSISPCAPSEPRGDGGCALDAIHYESGCVSEAEDFDG